MNNTIKKILYLLVLVVFSIVSFYAGKITKPSSIEETKETSADSRYTNLVMELQKSKNVHCKPFWRQVWPYNDFYLSDKTMTFPVLQNADIQKEFCDFLLQKGPSVLENITFNDIDYPPYFKGFATLSFKQEPVNSPTSTNSIIYNQVYLTSFDLIEMNDSSYQLSIHQIALLDTADKVNKQSIISLGENGRQLKIEGVNVAGDDFEHYFIVGVDKGNSLYFGEIN